MKNGVIFTVERNNNNTKTNDMKAVSTVLQDVKFRVENENPTATDKLKAIKVINTMKLKRNSKRGVIKEDYNQIIKSLEADYER